MPIDKNRAMEIAVTADQDAIEGLMAEIERLRAAITKTLEDNRHLADGENCTLIHLKRVINQQSRSAATQGTSEPPDSNIVHPGFGGPNAI